MPISNFVYNYNSLSIPTSSNFDVPLLFSVWSDHSGKSHKIHHKLIYSNFWLLQLATDLQINLLQIYRSTDLGIRSTCGNFSEFLRRSTFLKAFISPIGKPIRETITTNVVLLLTVATGYGIYLIHPFWNSSSSYSFPSLIQSNTQTNYRNYHKKISSSVLLLHIEICSTTFLNVMVQLRF